MPNDDPAKLRILLVHMAGGMVILALMAIRLLVRLMTRHPAAATTGYPSLDRLAPLAHYGFYGLVLLMVATGFATAILAGLNRSVFQGTGEPLSVDFDAYPSFVAHSWLAAVFPGVLALHVVAALYHQFVRRDALFRRMGFGRRALPS